MLKTCNYDSWTTKVPVSVTNKMQQVLTLMQDGIVRSRADMLRSAGIDPNPRYGGIGSSELTDYFLYKKGLINVIKIEKNQKYFQIA